MNQVCNMRVVIYIIQLLDSAYTVTKFPDKENIRCKFHVSLWYVNTFCEDHNPVRRETSKSGKSNKFAFSHLTHFSPMSHFCTP